MKIGVISDIHKRPYLVPYLLEEMKKSGVDTLVLNGDLMDMGMSEAEARDSITYVMEAVLLSGLETYVMPGNHDSFEALYPIIDFCDERYDRVHGIFSPTVLHGDEQDILLLPGSHMDGDFRFGTDAPSGWYAKTQGGATRVETVQDYQRLVRNNQAQGLITYHNIEDIVDTLSDTKPTIAICHEPMMFETSDAIDASALAGYRNSGSLDLYTLFALKNISVAVCGHIHEWAGYAHDANENHVPPGTFSRSLHYDASYAEEGRAGIVELRRGEARYTNIDLFERPDFASLRDIPRKHALNVRRPKRASSIRQLRLQKLQQHATSRDTPFYEQALHSLAPQRGPSPLRDASHPDPREIQVPVGIVDQAYSSHVEPFMDRRDFDALLQQPLYQQLGVVVSGIEHEIDRNDQYQSLLSSNPLQAQVYRDQLFDERFRELQEELSGQLQQAGVPQDQIPGLTNTMRSDDFRAFSKGLESIMEQFGQQRLT
ncbi:metallophosphoesterase [Candidatus Woesearchaeota archaeon]|nr:MAG: hypothetical protein QS99_C0001G0036 [archaeon GW2011_AR4]MBS3129249.1 metallophosphoesterase [Candidatus Woesearchaeota archaeon]HIH38552.1 hypothetical protein [Candidatus Woesearchaeota archaeon]HIH48507.1 hypothetical protein [Candidatus Woesearchaeota archaeon]HIJ02756.1 hypothetical protein [Candidatus Woesearchaeota archaeon]